MTTISRAVPATGIHHIRMTVTDLARSRYFYETVLGFEVVAASEGSPDDPEVRTDPMQLYGGVVFQISDMLFGLRPVADKRDRFISERVGLDHLSFAVESVDDLKRAEARLDEYGVERGVIFRWQDFGIAILSLSDPDGIHLELTAPLR